MTARRITFPIALLLALARISFAADSWTLTTADFQTSQVVLRAIDDKGVHVAASASDKTDRVIPFDQLLQLDRAGASQESPATNGFVAWLSNGDRYSGQPVSINGDLLHWKNNAVGEIKLSMKRLRAIVRSNPASINAASAILSDATKARAEDIALLANGDSVRGVLVSFDATGASIQPSAGGDSTLIPADSLLAIVFAETSGAPSTAPAKASDRRFRITLSDDSALSAHSPSINDRAIVFTSDSGEKASAPLDSVVSIEQINGPVIWLSSLAPNENVQTPYLETTWPARMNATLSGAPIEYDGKVYSRGIGVHSYSRLSWPIDRSMLAFRTQYAIDGDRPYADVTVRIKLDGKVAYEKKNVRAGILSPVVMLETNGAASITLEVDYGENTDVQDRVNWIEPALLRYKPALPTTVPATNPNQN